MKISLVIPSFYPAIVYGGPIFSTLHTCIELAKLDDIEIYVSTTNANMHSHLDIETGKWIKQQENFYVKYYNDTILNKISFPLFLNIWRDIKNAEIVHIQSIFSTSTVISLLYAKLFNKPIVLSPRGQFGNWCLDNGRRSKEKWLKWFIKPFAKTIIWHATAEQEKLEIQALFPDSKVTIVPNGIDFQTFQLFNKLTPKEYVKKYTKQEKKVSKIIISMGRLQKKKGFDILIKSFKKVLEVYPAAILLIAGPDEGEQENLEKLINRLNLENNVFLVGSISGQDKVDFLANADVFALPSYNENFGNVYLESLASGTPIVASKNTPWQKVEEADCGRWVNNSVEETAQAILEMLEKDREQMRINTKAFSKKYNWKNIALRFKEIFVMIVEES